MKKENEFKKRWNFVVMIWLINQRRKEYISLPIVKGDIWAYVSSGLKLKLTKTACKILLKRP